MLNKQILNKSFAATVRLLCGVQPLEPGRIPRGPKVFFANHTSHLDFVLIWSVLPYRERIKTRPVAGRDYWIRNKLSRWISSELFNALLIERKQVTRSNNPLARMTSAIHAGYSLIVFPEGTRHEEGLPGPFKSGIHHLARNCPEIPLVPVYLENLNRMLPRGSVIPLPLISRVTFGRPVDLNASATDRGAFLEKLRTALTNLIPRHE